MNGRQFLHILFPDLLLGRQVLRVLKEPSRDRRVDPREKDRETFAVVGVVRTLADRGTAKFSLSGLSGTSGQSSSQDIGITNGNPIDQG